MPKPLIDVNGKHMIEVVINNLKVDSPHRFIFVCSEPHIRDYRLEEIFSKLCIEYAVVVATNTEGPAAAVMDAKELIDSDEPLMIANSDQWVDININDYLSDLTNRNLDGSMLTMTASDTKWSYAKVDENTGLVSEVVEKKVISNEATVGIYNFKSGRLFCEYTEKMKARDIRHNGELYVAPVYTLMADDSYSIGVYNIGTEACGMYGLGTPEDLSLFMSLDVSQKATNF